MSTTLPTVDDWKRLAPHPRLIASAERLAALRNDGDEVTMFLRTLVKHDADRALVAEPIVYPPTGFMMYEVRAVQGRVLALAMQYRLTGDTRYFAKAREELLKLAALPEWRPSHFLDVGEAAFAAGVGLDWLYDDLSEDDRNRIARAIVKNSILPSLEVPEGGNSWVRGDFNWAQVCHAGVVVGALSIAEWEPELAKRVLERAVTNFDRVGASYSPDGAYAEGPSYWSYGTIFHVILIDALRSAIGTSCGLETFPGFLKTAEYINQMMAPTGKEFDYADYHDEHFNRPVLLWFARQLRDRNIARGEICDLKRLCEIRAAGDKPSPGKQVVCSRHVPLALLWWDASMPASDNPGALHWSAGGQMPLGVIRSAWGDPNASFVAVKGGTPNHSHAHMDVGSFILESDGVRWAIDLGTEAYANMRAAKLDLWNYSQNSSRWTAFRAGPEGHNILRFDGRLQDITGKGEVRILPDENGSKGNVVELTSLYRNQVNSAMRTVRLNADRSIVIHDEWTTGEAAVKASFQWLTRADVTRDATGLLLRQEGKTLSLHIDPPDAMIDVQDVSISQATQDSPNPGLSRIVISIPTRANSKGSITVRAAPGQSDTSWKRSS